MSVMHDYAPLLAATPVLTIIAEIDRRTQRIPDRLSLLAAATTAVTMTLLALGNGDRESLQTAAFGAVLLTSILGVLHAIKPDGLGMGDVKLALTLGLLLGWNRADALDVALMVAWCLMLASALGLVGVAAMTRRRGLSPRGVAVPFGPSLCAAAAIVALMGPSLILT